MKTYQYIINDREYRIKNTFKGMDYYGKCERCGKSIAVHYKQQSRKIGRVKNGWSVAGFGHAECLRNGEWENAPIVDDE